MHSSALCSLLAASLVMVHGCLDHAHSASRDISPAEVRAIQQLAARAPQPPPVDLFVHIVARSEERADGWLSIAEVDHQVTIIKDAYQKVGITFNHDPALHRNWSNIPEFTWDPDQTPDYQPMKRALHVGDYKTLNLYLVYHKQPEQGEDVQSGTCSNPWEASFDPKLSNLTERVKLDGCVVNQNTLDGSGHRYTNQGKTAVHEMGHWFGLFHPHESKFGPDKECDLSNPGDFVDDTPYMKERGFTVCNEGQDSCPKLDGKDPVHNFMSLSSDACMTEFTQGQKERMYHIFNTMRTNVTST